MGLDCELLPESLRGEGRGREGERRGMARRPGRSPSRCWVVAATQIYKVKAAYF